MTTKIKVLNPTVEPISENGFLAVRPSNLKGKKLGLLANGKENSEELLASISEVLSDHFEFASVIERNKGNASRPCPDHLVEEMAEECDVIITSNGD